MDIETKTYSEEEELFDDMRKLHGSIVLHSKRLKGLYDLLPNLIDRKIPMSMTCQYFEKEV